MKLSATAVYTTIAPERVFAVERGEDASELLFEKKRWVAAAKDLDRATKNRERFPIFFSDARDCSELLFWGLVEELKVTDAGTFFSFSHLQGLRDCFTQDLVLVSEKRNIAPGFIRPYAMVLTPDFLDEASMDAEERREENEPDLAPVDLEAKELVKRVVIKDEDDGWVYFLDDDGDLARLPEVRRRGQLPEKVQPLGIRVPPGFLVELESTEEGLDIFQVPLVDEIPAQAVDPPKARPRPARAKPLPPEAAPDVPTLFSWGYEGWGSSLPQLEALTTAAEAARGYEPPVFVDVRFSRSVRAAGFRERAFEKAVPPGRYHWMKGMGNAGIGDGGGQRIHKPADAAELLKLALAEHERKRRVIFFCSCGSLDGCHRNAVRELVLDEARRHKVVVQVAEWPGGEPQKTPVCTLTVPVKDFTRILEASRIPVTEELALTKFAALAWGSYVSVTDGKRHTTIAATPARFSAGKWFIEPFLVPVMEGLEPADLDQSVARCREQESYVAFSSTASSRKKRQS